MVAEFRIGFGNNAATLGTYTNKRLMARQPVAMADTVTFSHQPAAAAAAPQFGINWKTLAARGLVALTLGTTTPLVTSCEKGDQVEISLEPIKPSALFITGEGTVKTTFDDETGQGYSHKLTVPITPSSSIEQFLLEKPSNWATPKPGIYKGHPIYVQTPVTTYYPTEKTTLVGGAGTWELEIKANGTSIANFYSSLPFTATTDGQNAQIILATAGSALPPVDEKSLELNKLNVGDLVQPSQLISPEEALLLLNKPHKLNDLTGFHTSLFANAPNKYDVRSIDYSVDQYAFPADKPELAQANLKKLKSYMEDKLNASGLATSRVDKLVALLDNPTFKTSTANNPQLMAAAVYWAAADSTDGVSNALSGKSTPKYVLALDESLDAKMNTSKLSDGTIQIRIKPSAYAKVDPWIVANVIITNEWPEIPAIQSSFTNNRYAQNIQDMLGHLRYLEKLKSRPDLYSQVSPNNQSYNISLLDLIGSGPDMQPDLPKEHQKFLRGMDSKYANEGSYEATVNKGNSASKTATALITPAMRYLLRTQLGISGEEIPKAWDPTDLTFYTKVKEAIYAAAKPHFPTIYRLTKLEPS